MTCDSNCLIQVKHVRKKYKGYTTFMDSYRKLHVSLLFMSIQGKSKSDNGKVTGVVGGCLPDSVTCDSIIEAGHCTNTGASYKECTKCCEEQGCNTWLQDVQAWSGASVNLASFIIISVVAILSRQM